jgi:FMN reductase
VIVGNPKPGSRTRSAAVRLATELTGQQPDLVVDLATVGAGLLTQGDEEVGRLVARTRDADLLVVASPTYKATYTGLLKLFLDHIPYDGLVGVTAVPLMLGSMPGHAMAPEVGLRPVLVELGATVPTRGVYLAETSSDDPHAFTDWIAAARPLLGDVLIAPLLEGTPS